MKSIPAAAISREVLTVIKLYIPISLTILLFYTIRLTAVVASGHLTVDEMSAVSLANCITNILSSGTVLGICSASDTFFAQSFGADKKMMGIFLQQTFVVVGGAVILIVSLMLNMGRILPLLGQSQLVSEMASRYFLLLIPSVIFEALAYILSHYLQAQNKVLAVTGAVLLANIVNIISQVVAYKFLYFRYLASAFCESVSFFLFSFVLLSYIIISGICKDTWNGWTHKSLYNMKRFMKLAIPGWLLVIIEFGTFEIGVLVMGTISEVQMSAQSLLQVIGIFCSVWSLGFCEAVTIRIGQNLGSGLPEAAKLSFIVSTVMCVSVGACFSILCISLRTYLPRIITHDEDVIAIATNGMLYFSLFPFLECFTTVLAGVLRGAGQQLVIFIILIVGYVVIAQPIGIPLALLTEMQLGGIWFGYNVGLAFRVILHSVIIFRLDWQEQSDLAKERCMSEASEVHPEDVLVEADSKTYLLEEVDQKDFIRRKKAIISISLVYTCLGIVLVLSVVSFLTKCSTSELNTTLT